MKSFILPLTVIILLPFSWAHAVEVTPSPDQDKQEKVEKLSSGGALKVEQKPAMTAHELESASAPVATANKPASENLFGAHAAIGFPHIGSLGFNYVHPSHYFSAELSVGGFNATVSDTKVDLKSSDIGLRWHPWAGSFYLGVLLGRQVLKVDKKQTLTVSGQSQDVNAHVEVKSNYVTPHVGWMWGGQDQGFFTSVELGYQSPSKVTTDFTTDAQPQYTATSDYQNLQKDVRDQGDKFGNTGLPHFVLFKIGWLF